MYTLDHCTDYLARPAFRTDVPKVSDHSRSSILPRVAKPTDCSWFFFISLKVKGLVLTKLFYLALMNRWKKICLQIQKKERMNIPMKKYISLNSLSLGNF